MKTRNSVCRAASASLLPILLFSAMAAFGQNAQTTISVDADANQHPINPNIYGLNWAVANDMTALNATLDRIGGNASSRYNWQLDAHSSAADWYFETFPDSSGTPGASMDGHIATARTNPGAEPMLTIPMIDWLANLGPNRSTLWGFSVSKYGPQTATDSTYRDAGNGVSSATNQDITGNDPRDTGTPNSPAIQQGFVQHLVSNYGPSTSSSGIKYYILDNEPSIWQGTHRDVHPNHATYDEMLSKTEAYIKAIRAADPNAKIVGFEEWTWVAMFQSAFDQGGGLTAANSDYNTHNRTYYYPWLLQQLYAYQQSSGIRMLDMLSVHCYNMTPGDDSASSQLLRNRETRILWDQNYVDPTWMANAGVNGGVLNWIPTLKSFVNQYYPGLQVGCTEWNFGDESSMSGATAQADVLGIYGREGLDFATRWGSGDSQSPVAYYPTYFVTQLYRNYDGAGSTFGDTSVSATVANPDDLSAFAARRSSDGALTVMVVNKQQGSTPVVLNLANWKSGSSAEVWQVNSPSQSSVERLANVGVSNNQISTTVPSQSVTLFVIPGNGPTAFGAAANPAPATIPQAQSTAINFTLTPGQSISNANVLLQVYDPNNNVVASNTWSGQNLTGGSSVALGYTWAVPANQAAGTYKVQLGVFDSSWSTTYYWNSALTTLSVVPTGSRAFTVTASPSSGSLTQGDSTDITLNVTESSGPDLVSGNVLLQVFNSSGQAVMSHSWAGQNLSTSAASGYPLHFLWTTPSTLPSGTYTVAVGIFERDWSNGNYWNSDLATINVAAGGSGTPQFAASGATTPMIVAPGAPTSFSVSVAELSGAAVSSANVLLQIFDSSGHQVVSTGWNGQNFAFGQGHTYSYTWNVPGTQGTGNYTAEVGVFSSDWSTGYYWNGNLTPITVGH